MRWLGALAGAVLGVPGGMFANLLVDRIPGRQSLRPLPDLATLIRSRRCLVVIAFTAALYAGTVLRFGADWAVPAYLVFFTAMVAISVIDFDIQIIPNWIVYPTGFLSVPLLTLAALVQDDWSSLRNALIGASLALVAMYVIHFAYPPGMGFGDVRLSFVLGLFLGWLSLGHVLSGLFLGVILLAGLGILLSVLRVASLRDNMAFGPFLIVGTTVAIFVGPSATGWLTGS